MLRLLGTIRRHGTTAKSTGSDSPSPKHSIECKVMLLDGTDLTIRLHVSSSLFHHFLKLLPIKL